MMEERGSGEGIDPRVDVVKGYRPIDVLIPAHWVEERVFANGIEHHYWRTGGEKPQVVLLHGILAGGLHWLRVAKALERDYDVILLDARGHGKSDGIASGLTYPRLVEDVTGVIRALDLERPAVLGHSMGGITAALLAAAQPELVQAVMLEDAAWGDESRSSAIASSEGYQVWLRMYTAYLETLKTQTHEQRMIAALSQQQPGAALPPEEEYVAWVECQAQLDMELIRMGPSLWYTMKPEPSLRELVRDIACPMLLLAGNPERGGSGDSRVIEPIIANRRGGRYVYFEDAGHLIHVDQYERFVAEVRSFLDEVSPPQPERIERRG